jgi:hypothetical protein
MLTCPNQDQQGFSDVIAHSAYPACLSPAGWKYRSLHSPLAWITAHSRPAG